MKRGGWTIFTVFLPSFPYDAVPVGRVEWHAASNSAMLFLDGKPMVRFFSVAVALDAVKKVYPNAFLEEE